MALPPLLTERLPLRAVSVPVVSGPAAMVTTLPVASARDPAEVFSEMSPRASRLPTVSALPWLETDTDPLSAW